MGNEIKEKYKNEIADFIAEKILVLENEIEAIQIGVPHELINKKFSTIKYLANSIKKITGESTEEIHKRLEEMRPSVYRRLIKAQRETEKDLELLTEEDRAELQKLLEEVNKNDV